MKSAIVSGANAGIGYETAKGLLKKDFKVAMFCRNKQKAEEAKKNLIKATGNDKVEIYIADMASFASIQNACEDFKSKNQKLDVLINNAGGTFSNYEKTVDGVEKTMAVNHLGYFLMTYHLLPLIKNAEKGRIINVASKSHFGGKLDFETLNEAKGYFVYGQYENSKLANVLFTKSLAKKLSHTNITVNCLHPGVVKTAIGNKSGVTWHGWIWSLFSSFGISTEKGAETSLYLALSDEVEKSTGKYFDKCIGYNGSKLSQNESLQEQLWAWSEKMTGLSFKG